MFGSNIFSTETTGARIKPSVKKLCVVINTGLGFSFSTILYSKNPNDLGLNITQWLSLFFCYNHAMYRLILANLKYLS